MPTPTPRPWAGSRRPFRRALVAAAAALALVAVPEADVGAAPASNGGWTSEATVNRAALRPRATLIVDVTISAADAREGLVDIEINDPDGARTFQRFWDDQSFSADGAKSYRAIWSVPADAQPGEYVVRVGVFRVGWGVLYHWHHVAATFEVTPRTPEPPPTTPPVPTTTDAPPPPTTAPPAPPTTVAPAPPTTVAPAPPTTVAPAPPTTAPPAPPTTVAPAPPTTPPTSEMLFTESFTTAAGLGRFNWEIFHGGIADIFTTDGAIPEWVGDHDGACGGPTTERVVHVHADAAPGPIANMGEQVYWCAPSGPDTGHFMTSMNSPGYSHLDFSPAQSFAHVGKVCWDQNLTELSGQKWTQVTIVSEASFQANAGIHRYVTPQQEDEIARNGIKLQGDDFMFELLRGSTATFVGRTIRDENFAGFPGFQDKAQRFRHCLTDLDDGTVRIELFDRQGPGSVETRIQRGGWNDGAVRVIFQDITYHPAKDPTSQPTHMTWHWDNIAIS